MQIEVKDLTVVYAKGTPFEHTALDKVSFSVNQGEFVGIIGHTGSGKSTLLTTMAGLTSPTSGEVLIDGKNIFEKKANKKWLRSTVGVVFQYPEYQLFEETVGKDIAFGPLKQGLTPEEAEKRVMTAMEQVGLDYDKYRDKSPFELSGGQKRKAALAGVLALQPKILFMDEPIAGLDPVSRQALMDMTLKLNKAGVTIVMISHNMEGVCEYASRVLCFSEGKLTADGTAKEVFSRREIIHNAGLELPFAAQLVSELNEKGWALSGELTTYDEVLAELKRRLAHE